MRQLILDLLPERSPTLDNFVSGQNAETLSAFTAWLAGASQETAFCVWGETGSGTTHLLRASGFSYHDAQTTPDLGLFALEETGNNDHTFPETLAIDHVEALDAKGQITLFNLFNRQKARGGRLLTAAAQPPHHLALREDLRTRLGSGLIYRLHPLSDGEKAAALARQAQERALKLSPEAIDYLLRHAPRDMRTLAAIVEALDRLTLEYRRPVTLPLLRELLQEQR